MTAQRLTLHRVLLLGSLLLFAVFFLTPLYVMLSTSLKSMDEIRTGTLLSLPAAPNLAAWSKAWTSACTGTDCGGLKPFFMNSVLMVVPAVAISTVLGALNGYVLAKWRFRGSELMFALLLFGVLALSYLGKLVRYPDLVKHEFSHPVIGSFFGTVGISILLLSSVIGAYSTDAQLVVWSIGTVVTLALSGVMISRLLNGSAAPTSVVPAWLIAGVGSLDIVVTGGALTAGWTHEVNLLAAAIGGVSALVFFVLIFSRLVHQEPLAQAMRPSKMILVAPFAVGFIAYVNLVQKVDMFAALLFYFALFLFVIIGYRLIVKPAPFSPAWWAIGFPMAALCSAAMTYSSAVGGKGLEWIALLLLFLLTVSIAALAIRTVHALCTGRLLTA